MKKVWWKEAVVYQIYPRSFQDSNGDGIGDLRGILSRLDYLQQLGVDVLWLNPVYDSPNDDNGYDIANYQTIQNDFGTIADWEELLEGVHARGMKLIMDLVINHTSDEHQWFVESRNSRDNPYRDFYIWRDGKDGSPPNNWASFFEGSAWTLDESTGQYYLHLFSQKQPDLNWENPVVEKEIFEMIRWWLEKGIDGFRMDVINLLKKPAGFPDSIEEADPTTGLVLDMPAYSNNAGMHDILKRLHSQVLSHYDLFTVGEVIATTPEEAINYVAESRNELQMLIHFDVPALTRNWSLEGFKGIQKKWYSVIESGGWNAQYLSNHDQPRQVSIFGDDNKYWKESAKMLALLNHTLPGTVFIHQGEEIGMTNGQYDSIEDFRDISALRSYAKRVEAGEDKVAVLDDLRKFSRDNGRLPVQWDDSANAGFTEGTPWIGVNPNYTTINIARQLKEDDSILSFYKQLIQFRKESPCLVYGEFTPLCEDHQSIYAYTRTLEDSLLLVLLNFTGSRAEITLDESIPFESLEFRLSSSEFIRKCTREMSLAPFEALLFEKSQ
jgi:oligo-1,6-glucosidase